MGKLRGGTTIGGFLATHYGNFNDMLSNNTSISLSGDVSGSGIFDENGEMIISTVVANNSHSHTISNITNLQTTLNTKALKTRKIIAGGGLTGGGTLEADRTISHDTSSQASVNNSGRTYIQDITLDIYGHIIGLTSAAETVVNTDTDTWRGIDNTPVNGNTTISISSDWAYDHATSTTAHEATSANTINKIVSRDNNGDIFINKLHINAGVNGGISFPNDAFGGGGDTANITLINPSGGESTEFTFKITNDADDIFNFISPSNTGLKHNNNTVWTSGNDGNNSGLDADLLDGYDSDINATANTIVLRNSNGNFSAGTISAALNGNATSATKLKNTRTIALSGDATGSVSFNGTSDVTIPVVVANNSHSHTISNITNLQTTLDTKALKTRKITAGGGLTGGGDLTADRTISHDTSSQASVNNSGRTYIQDITLDIYGHITGLTSAAETVVNTDTNTWRGIDNTPVNGHTTISISSDWAYYHGDTRYYTKSQVDSNIQTEISLSIPISSKGMINYYKIDSTREMESDWLIFEGKFADNSTELSILLSSGVSNETIFNTWGRFSHNTSETQPAIPAELNGWSYNNTTGNISSTINSSSYIGFYSNKKVSNFLLDVKLTSTSSDDDTMAVVIAFAVDNTGREYTLSAIRDNDGQQKWAIYYNFARSDQWLIASSNIISDGSNWNSYPNGTRIKIRRNNDIIEAWSTQNNSSNFVESAKFNINLNSDSRLYKFRGNTSYGYSCRSQADSTFSDIQFIEYSASAAQEYVFDINNNDVYVPDGNGSYTLDTSKSIVSEIGNGKIIRDIYSDKSWYISADDSVNKIDTWRGIESTPVNGHSTISISSAWAYDHDIPNTRKITAGGGLTGGGTLAADRTISHADTSSQLSVNNIGRTYIQDITLDTYGHITGLVSATETVVNTDTNTWRGIDNTPVNGNTTISISSDWAYDHDIPKTRTITVGGGLTGGGELSADITISHANTSSQASVDNNGSTFIQDITLDTYGHITGITSATASSSNTIVEW